MSNDDWKKRALLAEGERDEAVAFHNAREAEYLREVQRGGEWNDRALKAESELDELRLRHATDAVVAQRDTRTVTPLIDHSSIAAVVREIIAEGVTFIPDAKFAEQRAAEKAAMDEQTRIYVERDAEDKAWRKLIIERDDRRHLEMGALMIRAAQVQALTKQGCMDYGEWSYQQVARDAKQAIAACREPVSEASVDMPPGARDQGNAPDSEEMAVLFRENRRLTIALAAAEARIAAARKACEEYSEAGIVGEMMLRALAGEP